MITGAAARAPGGWGDTWISFTHLQCPSVRVEGHLGLGCHQGIQTCPRRASVPSVSQESGPELGEGCGGCERQYHEWVIDGLGWEKGSWGHDHRE